MVAFYSYGKKKEVKEGAFKFRFEHSYLGEPSVTTQDRTGVAVNLIFAYTVHYDKCLNTEEGCQRLTFTTVCVALTQLI